MNRAKPGEHHLCSRIALRRPPGRHGSALQPGGPAAGFHTVIRAHPARGGSGRLYRWRSTM
jgi:hypothetical protein